jgi:hypothetical protein
MKTDFGSAAESKRDPRLCNFLSNNTLLSEDYRGDKESCMAFTEDEMRALQLLLREELQAELRPFRNEVNKRFDEVATQVDGLYRRDEKREQEYLSIREQMRRLEARSN